MINKLLKDNLFILMIKYIVDLIKVFALITHDNAAEIRDNNL